MTMTRRFARVLLPLLAAGCQSGTAARDAEAPAPRAAIHTAASPGAEHPGQPSYADIQAALVSVYYYAYLVRDGRRPALQMAPIPLDQAAEKLSDDHSFGASARRRRAIGKLGAAYRLLTVPGGRRVPLKPDNVSHALKVIGAPPSVIVEGTSGQGNFQRLESGVYALLDQEPSPVYRPQCCSCVMSCDTFVNGGTGKGHFIIRVGRELDGANGLKSVVDPLNWAACNPVYFNGTYYAGPDCPNAKSGTSPTSTTLPTPGEDWSGVIYEHFANPGLSLTNLLDICPYRGKTGTGVRRFDYDLCSALSGSAKLTADCGYATAMPDGDTSGTFKSRLDGLKIVEFAPPTSASTIGLEAMVDETAQVAVCCGLQEPQCPCSTWTCYLASGPGSVQNEECPYCPSTMTTTTSTITTPVSKGG